MRRQLFEFQKARNQIHGPVQVDSDAAIPANSQFAETMAILLARTLARGMLAADLRTVRRADPDLSRPGVRNRYGCIRFPETFEAVLLHSSKGASRQIQWRQDLRSRFPVSARQPEKGDEPSASLLLTYRQLELESKRISA